MDRIFMLKLKIAIVIFAILDLLCVGLGMGVPIFCILFGFLVGWYIARRAMIEMKGLKKILKRVLTYAIITSSFTFLVMCIIWGPMILWLFDPQADFINSGIPLILYDPKLSFIGWLLRFAEVMAKTNVGRGFPNPRPVGVQGVGTLKQTAIIYA